LEMIRQPLEDGSITVSRAKGTVTFPAQLMLICSMNPCRCGYWGTNTKECKCTPRQVEQYMSRISGPLLDRIDIHIEVPRVEYDKLGDECLGEPTDAILARVEAARQVQRQRFKDNDLACNADMRVAEVRQHCQLDDTGRSLMRTAMSQMQLSARAYHRILKLARTIADLVGSESITPTHLAEAIQYRPKGLQI
ncbi:MAG: ATP-binding protein, partial [Anaerolineales bacterium]|nr:ATP-binding protein [Anaerolineales bacterium]